MTETQGTQMARLEIDDASTGSVDAATGPRAFGPPILISEANSDGNDRFGTVSDNGNTLFFTRNRGPQWI